jgi:hypothetical protein
MLWRESSLPKLKELWSKTPYDDDVMVDCVLTRSYYHHGFKELLAVSS